jgi:3-dehydroquinate dehydratase I
MLCISTNNLNFKELKTLVSRHNFLEIRLDLCNISDNQARELFSSHKNLIATFRKNSDKRSNNISGREKLLKTAIQSGAKYIDLDISTDLKILNNLKKIIKQNNTKLILSYHSHEKIKTKEELQKILTKISSHNPDIIKIACFCQNSADIINILELYKINKNIPLIALPMGSGTEFARILALQLGSPFIYCSQNSEQKTALGQLTYQNAQRILNLLEK